MSCSDTVDVDVNLVLFLLTVLFGLTHYISVQAGKFKPRLHCVFVSVQYHTVVQLGILVVWQIDTSLPQN